MIDESVKQELIKKYPNLITKEQSDKKYGPTLAAKNIRIELKKTFPGIKFSVKSQSYANGNSVHIRWTGTEPTNAEVRKITQKYKEGSFDGMTDSYNYNNDPFVEVFGGAKYIFEFRYDKLADQGLSFSSSKKEVGMFTVSRAIEGISTNGKKYVLDHEGKTMKFGTYQLALDFLLNNGITDEDIDDGIVNIEEEE